MFLTLWPYRRRMGELDQGLHTSSPHCQGGWEQDNGEVGELMAPRQLEHGVRKGVYIEAAVHAARL